jgi:hypothetical protein
MRGGVALDRYHGSTGSLTTVMGAAPNGEGRGAHGSTTSDAASAAASTPNDGSGSEGSTARAVLADHGS